MKLIKKIIFFISIFALYIILKEFIHLYSSLNSIHPYLGYAFIVFITLITVYFLFIPIIKIFKIPKDPGPTLIRKDEEELIKFRMKNFSDNIFLNNTGYIQKKNLTDRENYDKAIELLEVEVNRMRKRDVSKMFYTTSIAQNGFLDAILILSGSLSHIKEIFLLYNGRVSNRNIFSIFKKVYYSMAIGGSEGVEYVTEEIFSKFAVEGLKNIPFIDKILSSLADGFVNSVLLTRISLITENYCKMTYLEKEKDLYPSAKIIIITTRNITSDIVNKIYGVIKKMSIDKTINFAQIAINPVGYVVGISIDKSKKLDIDKKERLKEHAKLVCNPFAYTVEKLYISLRKNKK